MPVIEALLNQAPLLDGRDPLTIPLVGAAESCQPEVARLLLSKGADPNAPYSNGMAERYKLTPPTALMQAAEGGCVDLAAVLLDHGANPNLTTPNTALAKAVMHKSEPMVRYLRIAEMVRALFPLHTPKASSIALVKPQARGTPQHPAIRASSIRFPGFSKVRLLQFLGSRTGV